jgi:hypothetical protein
MQSLYRGPFIRLVSLCRFAHITDAVVYVCFSSEMASCCSILNAMALRSHGGQIRGAETVTPLVLLNSTWAAGLATATTPRSTLRLGLRETLSRRPAALSPRQQTLVTPEW